MAQKQKVVISLVVLLFLTMLVFPMIMAAGTQQYSKIFLNPFYRESLTAGTNYSYNITVNPPDKIGSVSSAILSWNAQINGQSQVFYIWVNGQPCNTANYTVATAFSTTGNVQFSFDCSNRITKAGTYNVTMKSAVNTGAMIGWLDLTYMSNPSGLTIHGTEYNAGDPGKVWLQLLDSDKTPIDNATCFMTMYTPNNLQLYSYLQMFHLANGIYSFDFFAPEAVGVYPVVADCYYITAANMSYANNYSIFTGSIISGNAASLSANDGNRLKISEQTVNGPGLDFNMSFSNVSDILLETDLVIGLHGRWSGRDIDPIYIQIWNYTSGSWITTSNKIPNTGGMDVDTTNVFVIPTGTNATAMGLIKNSSILLRFVDVNITDSDLEQLQIDSLWINIVAQGSTGTWEQVKGSSEVHVNNNGGHLYTWNTLCDNHNPICAVFSPSPPDSLYSQTITEGVINETLNVNNIYRASLQDTIEYDTALGLDCTGVISIIETYNDGTTLDVTDTTEYNIGDKQNCKMNIPIAFESNQQNMKIQIISDNYPKWEVEWAKNVVDGMAPTITNYCNDVANKEGVTYNLPINTTIDNTSGLSPEATYCYRAMDDLWYFENNYQLSQSINTIGPYLSYLSESRFYYPLVYDHYNRFKQSINPISVTIKVAGTDYQIGDNGKIFLQLLQSNNVAINNASCYASVFYPNGTQWLNMVGMIYQTGSSGLYYYDFIAPNVTGVYMVDTVCSQTTQTVSANATAYVIGKGWYFSGNGTSLTVTDGNFLTVSEKNYNPGYVNTTVSTLLMAHLDEGNGTVAEDTSANPATGTNYNGPTLGVPGVSGTAYYYPVGSYYTNFAQVSKFNLNSTEQYMVCFSFNESTTNANGARLVDSLGAGSGFRFSFDTTDHIRYVSSRDGSGAKTITGLNSYLDSKWHTVCGYSNFTNQVLYIDGVLDTNTAVVQTGAMTLANGVSIGAISTGGGNYVNAAVDEVCYMKGTFGSGQSAASLVAAYNTSKQCGIANSSMDMNVTIPAVSVVNVTGTNPVTYSIVSTYQWDGVSSDNVITQIYNYSAGAWLGLVNNLTLASSTATVTSQFTPGNISQFLNTNGNMTIRYYTLPMATGPNQLKLDQVRLDQTNNVQLPQPDTGPRGSGELNIRNYSFDLIPKIPNNVWNYSGNISQNILNQFSTSNGAAIAQAVWTYASRNLTYFDFVTQALNVWNATSRNLTYYNMTDTTNYTLAAQTVWTYTNRNLTYFDYLTQAGTVWNYTNRNLTYFDFTTAALTVWNSTSRNLTYFDFQTQANVVWNSTNRSITYYPDLTNYLTIAQNVWNNTNRNLTYFDFVTAAANVWNATTRNLTYYQDVTNYTLAAQTIWAYPVRNLTYYQDVFNYTLAAQTIWNFSTRNLTYYQDVTNYTLMTQLIWNYVSRNLTYTPDMTNYLQIQNLVWNATNRNLTYYQDVMNYTLDAQTVWNYVSRNLTSTQDVTNYSNIQLYVWNYTSRTLTAFPIVNATIDPSTVWNYTSRNLTYTQDVTNYSQIYIGVWNYTTRNLTYYNLGNNLSASDVWNYVSRNLTYTADVMNYTLSAQTVWNYLNRNLTSTQDVTNYSNIQVVVWNATTRNLTYYQPTDLSQVPASIWNYTTRNLTYTPDMTNYSQIFIGVWNYTTRNLTYYQVNNISTSDIWNYVSRNLTYTPDMTNYTLVAQTVWTYLSRNLTYTQDATNYSNIQVYVWNATARTLTSFPIVNATVDPSTIWNYTNRSLTYYPDVTNYSNIFIGVWNYTTRNLTYYNLGNNLSANDVWNYVSRNLTYSNVTIVDYPTIQAMVWNATDRNLTYFPTVNATIDPATIWEYTSRNLTYYNVTIIDYPTIQAMVWNATNRNLTYYNMTDTTNYNLLAQVVWNFSARNLTYYNLGNNLSANDVWNFVSRNLTFYQDVTNYSLASQSMWSYNNRTLTYYQINNISVADIWGYMNRSLTENISQEVWFYQDRNLTYYNMTDTTNYSLGAETVWQYINRSLTEDIPFEVWTYSGNRNLTENISLDVWSYYNRSLTLYPDVTNYSLVWTYTNRSLTSDPTNYSAVAFNVWNYGGTINSNILTQFAFAFWNYAGTITTVTNQISQNVWSYPARYTHGEILD